MEICSVAEVLQASQTNLCVALITFLTHFFTTHKAIKQFCTKQFLTNVIKCVDVFCHKRILSVFPQNLSRPCKKKGNLRMLEQNNGFLLLFHARDHGKHNSATPSAY